MAMAMQSPSMPAAAGVITGSMVGSMLDMIIPARWHGSVVESGEVGAVVVVLGEILTGADRIRRRTGMYTTNMGCEESE